MAYSTQADIEIRIPAKDLAGMTNDTSNSTVPNSSIVTAMIARADAFIDGKIGSVYTVPLSPVPDQIRDLSVDLACYYIMQRRWTQVKMPDDWKETHKTNLKMLDDIADLKIALEGAPTVAEGESGIVTPTQRVGFEDTDSIWSYF